VINKIFYEFASISHSSHVAVKQYVSLFPLLVAKVLAYEKVI
jgi:hypothetical protein